MNTFKKIGLTALATSLVASSAYSADVTMSGAAGATWSTQSGNSGAAGDHGKGIGQDNSISFSMSGELDNGWSVSAGTALTDAFALSSNNVKLTMGDWGTIMTGNASGGNAASFDGNVPYAYEEVDDGGASSLSTNILGSTQDTGGLHWTLPAMDIAGLAVQAYLGYSPVANDAAVAGGGVSGISTTWASGRDAGIAITHDSGLSLGAYVEEKDRQNTPTGGGDYFGGTWYVTYAMGPVSIGWQESYLDAGASSSQANANTSKTVNTAAGLFEAEQYSVAFNVNDNLSVSYAKAEDTYDAQGGATGGSATGDAVADVAMDMKSIQAAYSMGSMSIKAYRTETDNVGYSTGGGSLTVNEIALGLSF